jgi:hypothetical protein
MSQLLDINCRTLSCNGKIILDDKCNLQLNNLKVQGDVGVKGDVTVRGEINNNNNIVCGRIGFTDFSQLSQVDLQILDSSFWNTTFETQPNMLLNSSSVFTAPTSLPGTMIVQVDGLLTCWIGDLWDVNGFLQFNIELYKNYSQTMISSLSNGVTLPATEIHVESTEKFARPSGSLFVNSDIGPQQIEYSNIVDNAFTGCTGGEGILFTGAIVTEPNDLVSNTVSSVYFPPENPLFETNLFIPIPFNDTVQLNPGDTLDIGIRLSTNINLPFFKYDILPQKASFANFKIVSVIP